jgi:hypothetical protein
MDGRQIEHEQAHVLHDEGIDADVRQVPGQLPRSGPLVVVQDGVVGDEDARTHAVGVEHQALDLGQAVASLVARAEGRAADVDGIGTVVDGLDADVGITGGSEQFEFGARSGGPDW